MQFTCPVCDYAESRAHRAMRLETCPRCRAAGREVYLADSTGKPPPTPLRAALRRAEARPLNVTRPESVSP